MDGAGGGAGDGGVETAPADAADPSSALFDPNHIVEVHIDMAAADWDVLRNQTRDLWDILGGDCVSAPFPSPFTYFPGTVTVDGQRLDNVGIKKKGFLGSLSTTKPALKLKLDRNVDHQRVYGMDTLTLNNARQDPAYVRQCLSYAAFTRAGLAAPRCNFAHVVVNDVNLGLYVNVESVDKDFLRRHFADVTGNLYEGTLSDFDPTFLNTFDLKTNEALNDRSDLAAVSAALTAPDAELAARLDPLIDMPEYYDYWAMESIVRQWDGYANNTNNFFVYHDPGTGRFSFLPWGIDGSLDANAGGADGPVVILNKADLARRLYAIPATRDRYVDRIRALLDVAFVEADVLREIDRMQPLVSPVVPAAEVAALRTALDGLRAFVRGRRPAVLAELAALPPVNTDLRKAPCLKPIGTIAGSFSTTWDTLAAANPFTAGTGTLTATVAGAPLAIDMVGTTAGTDTTGDDGPRTGINVIVHLTDGSYAAAALRLVPRAYLPGVTLPFDLSVTTGFLVRFDGATTTPLGLFGQGTLQLTAAGSTPGAAVKGSFSAELVDWPF